VVPKEYYSNLEEPTREPIHEICLSSNERQVDPFPKDVSE